MPAPVYIDFVVRGMPNVAQAFRSVESIVTGSEAKQTSAAVAGSKARLSDAEKWERTLAKIKERSATMLGQWAVKAARAEATAGRKAVSDAKTAETDKTAIAEAGAKNRARIRERSATMAGAFAKKQAADEERAAERSARATATAARGAARGGVREERWLRHEFARAVGGSATQALHSATGATYRAAAHVGGTLMQLGGGFSFAGAIGQQAAIDREAQLVANSAEQPGKRARPDTAAIIANAKATSVTAGIDADKLLHAQRTYLKSSGGDWEGAQKNLGFFGKISKVTSADLEAVAQAAGTIKVQNDHMTPAEQEKLLLTVVGQGRSEGPVEMDDLAKAAGKVTRTSGIYAGNQTATQTELLGLAQWASKVTGGGTGGVTSAATMLSNIGTDTDMIKHTGSIDKLLGRKITNARGQINEAPSQLIADIFGATGGNLQKIQALGYGKQSMRGFQSIAPAFNDQMDNFLASGMNQKDAGIAAGKAIHERMTEGIEAPMSMDKLNEEFSQTMSSSAEQFEGAVRQLSMAAGEALLPEFLKLAALLVQLMPTIKWLLDEMIKMAEWAANNPFKSFGFVVMKFFLEELAVAGIGSLLRGVITGAGPSLVTPVVSGVTGVVAGGGTAAVTAEGGAVVAAGGIGIAAGAAVLGGALLNLAMAADQLDNVWQGYMAGSKETDRLKKLSPEEAAKGIAKADDRSGALDWITSALGATNLYGAAVLGGPAGILGHYAGNAVAKGITGSDEGTTESQIQGTVAAQTVVSNADEIRVASTALAAATTKNAADVKAAGDNFAKAVAEAAAGIKKSARDSNLVVRN